MKQHVLTTLCLIACSSMQSLYAQQIQIAGKITDSNGNPISGVTINVKGSSQGTSTNEQGLFTLNANSNATLLLSAVGYNAQEVQVNGRKTISVTLVGNEQALDEVVVTALGIKRSQKSIGYSAQQVKGDDLTFTKETNVLGSLAGKVAGAQVTGSSGANLGGTQKNQDPRC